MRPLIHGPTPCAPLLRVQGRQFAKTELPSVEEEL
jgi:hypothetical protein